jgi:hypothetical protein
MWWIFLGIIRLCGSPLLMSSRRKRLLLDHVCKKQKYLFIEGVSFLLLGLLWCGAGLSYPYLEPGAFWELLLIGSSIVIIVSLGNNKKNLGHWV